MRRIGLLIIAVLLLCSADVFAQCQKCEVAWGCLTCADTFYNGSVLCTISGNGTICLGQGRCDGVLGECKKGCVLNQASLPAKEIQALDDALESLPEPKLAETSPFRRLLQTDREWQLVSFKVTHGKARS